MGIRAQLLEEGGPELWREFMEELRHTHLGAPVAFEALSRDGTAISMRIRARLASYGERTGQQYFYPLMSATVLARRPLDAR